MKTRIKIETPTKELLDILKNLTEIKGLNNNGVSSFLKISKGVEIDPNTNINYITVEGFNEALYDPIKSHVCYLDSFGHAGKELHLDLEFI